MRTPLAVFFLCLTLVASLAEARARFQIWAPGATSVQVENDLHRWPLTPMSLNPQTGIWSANIQEAQAGDHYRFLLSNGSVQALRLDPESQQTYLRSWSVLTDPNSYHWQSSNFIGAPLDSAVIYELHVGSFNPSSGDSWGTFATVESKLDYLKTLGINYIELLPLHQSMRLFDWGYGVSLPNAIEESYGSADELKHLIDQAHLRGIGVIFDVVHNHYSKFNGLGCYISSCSDFFGTYFYQNEHAFTPWGPRPDFSQNHVRHLIETNIRTAIEEYKVDGFRWDATPYMTEYWDWDAKNQIEVHRGPNREAQSLIQNLNRLPQRRFLRIAEYFAAPASVLAPIEQGGLGFDSHWAGFFPVVDAITKNSRRAKTFQQAIAELSGSNQRVIFTENHDEVGHPPEQIRIPKRVDPNNPGSSLAQKKSLLAATLLFTSPGVPLIFQGQEFLEDQTFNFPTGTPLDWTKLETFSGIFKAYQDLIALRKNSETQSSALSRSQLEVFHQNDSAKVFALTRSSPAEPQQIVVLANFSSSSWSDYRIGLPAQGLWKVVFSSDDAKYSSDFAGTPKRREFQADSQPYDGFNQSAALELAPHTALVLMHLKLKNQTKSE